MPQGLRIALAILVIVVLVIIFVVSFILYKRTPPPKGCEDIHPSEEKCRGCNETACHFNLYYNNEETKKKTVKKNDNDSSEDKK